MTRAFTRRGGLGNAGQPNASRAHPAAGLTFDDMDSVLDAARQGAGLAFVFEAQVRDLIISGELVRVLATWCPPTTGFHLYYPSRRNLSFGMRTFLDFVRASWSPGQQRLAVRLLLAQGRSMTGVVEQSRPPSPRVGLLRQKGKILPDQGLAPK